ncbi:SEL1-like repeat protein [Desulfobotulus mexicanus]|uniref:Sel1 repeat family protein n=1 Tax=Desulfobotulus mexicanus TaxID=2586642 RepID=A0A5S5MDK4_9BACT|nr:SEL1-like repeat protein [Desulfobotulus mexicanus]TYT73784.1 hypothetical protein FIM25_13130 [Desulfobotulus mexicanus]
MMKGESRDGIFTKGVLLALFLILAVAGAGCTTVEKTRQTVNDAPNRLDQNESDEELVVRYRSGAEQGEADARYRLGELYKEGRGVAQDDAEAVKWFGLAAEQGHAGAQNALGVMYDHGRGVEKDYEEALKWYRKAADQGYVRAQNNLGFSYTRGRGVEKDDKEAVKWYRKAADQGHARAQRNLGWMYANGRGVEKDDKVAVEWYRKAADQGNAVAQSNLGWMYATGRGVEKDDKEAVKWYRKAADQGNAVAQSNLGFSYLNGSGVKQSDREALNWLRQAARQGNDRARKEVEERFNYDAMDDDTPVAYEDHLKAHSLELLDWVGNVSASDDGKRIVTKFQKKGGTRHDYVGASVWEYDARKESFVKHPFRFLHKTERNFDVALSPDGTLMAYSDLENRVVLVDLERNHIIRTITHLGDVMYGLAISHANERLALSYSDKDFGDKKISAYSTKEGKFLHMALVPENHSVRKMVFIQDGSLVVEYSVDDESRKINPCRVRIYNDQLKRSKEISYVRRHGSDYTHDDEWSIAGILPDGNRLALYHHGSDSSDDSENGIYNVRSMEWEVSGLPFLGKMVFGPPDHFVSDKKEYILQDDKVLLLQEAPVKIARSGNVVYVVEAGHWVFLSEDRQFVMEPASDELVKAMKVLGEGLEMVKTGFYEPGAAKMQEAITMYPAADQLDRTNLYADLADNNVPLKYIGGLLLTQYEELLKDEALDQKQAIAKAVERLRIYGLFASNAGHPELARQAAGRIRFLQGRYPEAAPWDQLLKNAVVLEALSLAAIEFPDKAMTIF